MTMSHAQELDAFHHTVDGSIRRHFEALRYKVEWLDDEVVAIVSPFAVAKIYCAGGHGYSFTITVARRLHREWNNSEEAGLAQNDERFDSLPAFQRALEASVQRIAAALG